MPTPLLLISDAPTSGSGLGRITRDIATRIRKCLPEQFRVATLGYAGPFSSKLGFPQYNMELDGWVIMNLPEVWEDFADTEHGIMLTVWDASRLMWFSRPENLSSRPLRRFLETVDAETWGYFPMDATGPHDRLTRRIAHTMEGYDRVLAYSEWACKILQRSLKPDTDLAWLPHGLDTSVWQPKNRAVARHGFGERIGARSKKGRPMNVPDDALMVGVVATNQVRKDYGLACEILEQLAKERTLMSWFHVDSIERYWNIWSLLEDFGLIETNVTTNLDLTDEQLAWCYSACDVTLGIGTGEGFGYPIFESLACGTPCIHGNDGGAPEHMPGYMLVEPVHRRLEGIYNCYRNVYRAEDWVKAINALPRKTGKPMLPDTLDWGGLWRHWQNWLLKGVK